MATLAVATFVLVAYTVIVGGDPGPTPGDVTAAEIAEKLRTAWLVDVAKAVTALGSSAVCLPLAAVAAASLVARRRWAQRGVRVAGLAIVVVGVHELKDAVDRPRPGDPLVAASGSSFPSAHAAYSTFYVWLAVTIVMRLRTGMTRGALVVATGIAITALVGLSRVYLGVHYMSDVNAGWALGAAAFSLCATVALVASTIRSMRKGPPPSDISVRQNGARAAAGPAEDRK
jgi:undecaprenyl-diphosphatase